MMKHCYPVLLLLILVASQSAAQKAASLTFLHINDPHTHVDASTFDLTGDLIPDGLSVPATEIRAYYGGAPRMVALIKKLQAEEAQAGRDVCTLHAGDALTGTLFYTAYGTAVDIAWMNAGGVFDAMVLGNHEFDNGDSTLAEFVEQVTTPVISYNLRVADQSSALNQLPEAKKVKPYIIKELANGERVGICGITVKVVTEQSSLPDKGTTFIEEVEATELCVKELEDMGINKIVLLTHTGYAVDQEKLATVPGVDVVIGGHEHAFLGDEAIFSPFGIPVRDSYASMKNGVCVVTAWEFNKVLGKLNVEFDEEGNVIDCSGHPILPFDPDNFEVREPEEDEGPLNTADAAIVASSLDDMMQFVIVGEDPETSNVLDPFRKQIDTVKKNKIANIAENICHTRRGDGVDVLCPTKKEQSLVGGGVCLLVAQAYLYNTVGADIALQNSGGCRTDLLMGELTLGQVFTLLPFSNLVVEVEMTGDQIRRVLEDSISFFLDRGGGSGSFPNGANIRWDMDMTETFGSRFTNIEVKETSGAWVPINLAKTYTVATINYVASGADGWETFTEIDPDDPALYTNTFLEYAQAFVNYATAKEVLSDPDLEDYSTQLLIDEDGNVTSIRALREAQGSGSDEDGSSSSSRLAGKPGLLIAFMFVTFGLLF